MVFSLVYEEDTHRNAKILVRRGSRTIYTHLNSSGHKTDIYFTLRVQFEMYYQVVRRIKNENLTYIYFSLNVTSQGLVEDGFLKGIKGVFW